VESKPIKLERDFGTPESLMKKVTFKMKAANPTPGLQGVV